MCFCRNLQEEVKELQKRKQDEECRRTQVEEVLAGHDSKFQEVNRKLERATDRCDNYHFCKSLNTGNVSPLNCLSLLYRLETAEKELRETQSLELKLLQSCRETEDCLAQRKSELDRVSTQVTVKKLILLFSKD